LPIGFKIAAKWLPANLAATIGNNNQVAPWFSQKCSLMMDNILNNMLVCIHNIHHPRSMLPIG
jgi:hypothetical protein